MRAIPATAAVAIVALSLAGCGGNVQEAASNPPSEMETSASWTALFDGTDLNQWRGYRRDDVPGGWRIEDSTLAFVPGGEGGDIVTREKFNDFELELEWRVSEGGNSGIFFWGSEENQHIWESAPEMQVLDNTGHRDGGDPLTSAGANYALHAPPEDVTRPVGEWNQVRIVARGNHVEHWLNGRKVVEYELGSPDWGRLVAGSKFNEMPAYGRYRRGHIALQDHGDRVWFRNVRIRSLDPAQ